MKTRLFSKITWYIMAALIIAMPAAIVHAAGNTIIIKGSTTVLPVAQAAAEVFMEKNPGVKISVQGGGSGVGIASLLDKTTDIADSSRKIKPEEIEKARAAGVNPNEIAIALDGIAVIVHPTNGVKAPDQDADQGHLHRQDHKLVRGRGQECKDRGRKPRYQ